MMPRTSICNLGIDFQTFQRYFLEKVKGLEPDALALDQNFLAFPAKSVGLIKYRARGPTCHPLHMRSDLSRSQRRSLFLIEVSPGPTYHKIKRDLSGSRGARCGHKPIFHQACFGRFGDR